MVGGPLPLTTASFFVNAIVLRCMDYARAALPLYGANPLATTDRQNLESALATMGRTLLGVSPRASRPAVLAELGWCSDAMRGARECLLFLNRLWNMPQDSIPRQCVEDGHADKLKLYCDGLMQELRLPARFLKAKSNRFRRRIKRSLPGLAEREWKNKMGRDPQAGLYARYRRSLRPPPYAALPGFRGRTTFTKARLNNLLLGSPNAGTVSIDGTCALCLGKTRGGWGSDTLTGTAQMHHFFLTCNDAELTA